MKKEKKNHRMQIREKRELVVESFKASKGSSPWGTIITVTGENVFSVENYKGDMQYSDVYCCREKTER